jgi:hypothetical protein
VRILRWPLAASLLAPLAGCNDSGRALPASPSPSQPVLHTVSGILSESLDGVSRPLAERPVILWVSQSGNGWTTSSTTDRNGRYAAQVPNSRVYVSAWHPPDLQQPCLASAVVDKDTTLDVQVVPTGRSVAPSPAVSPMISGFVYETTPQGRRPVRGVYVSVDALPYLEVYVATTQTDEMGRFVLCRVNAPVGLVVSASGYQPWSQVWVPGTSDMVLEIELKRPE